MAISSFLSLIYPQLKASSIKQQKQAKPPSNKQRLMTPHLAIGDGVGRMEQAGREATTSQWRSAVEEEVVSGPEETGAARTGG